MKQHVRPLPHILLLACGICSAVNAQIGNVVVTSGASFESGLPSKGSIASVFCTGLVGVQGVVQATTLPLPTQLAGVRVRVGGALAPLFAVAALAGYQQINIQVPQEAAFGDQDAEVAVEQDAQRAVVRVPLRLSSPGDFFRWPGTNFGIFQHGADYSLVTPENPARPGEAIIAYLTGLRGTTPTVPTGQASPFDPLAVVPQTFLGTGPGFYEDYCYLRMGGDLAATASDAYPFFLGLTPGSVGVYQLNVFIPKTEAGANKQIMLVRHLCFPAPPFGSCSSPWGPHRYYYSSPVLIPVQ
jgi:uncharacterized protein (TIGR03437 family)